MCVCVFKYTYKHIYIYSISPSLAVLTSSSYRLYQMFVPDLGRFVTAKTLSPRLCLCCPVFVDPVELTAELFHLLKEAL